MSGGLFKYATFDPEALAWRREHHGERMSSLAETGKRGPQIDDSAENPYLEAVDPRYPDGPPRFQQADT